MPGVAVITETPFWRVGRGDAARIRTLVRALAARFQVTVLFVGDVGYAAEFAAAAAAIPGLAITAPGGAHLPGIGLADTLAALRPDALLVEFARLAPLLPERRVAPLEILDTHNVYGASPSAWHLTAPRHDHAPAPAAEVAAWRRFDLVIAISAEEAALIQAEVGAARTLTCPHPPDPVPAVELRPEADRIGTVASNARANLEGIAWFVEAVLPRLPERFAFHVFGTYGGDLAAHAPRARAHGSVATVGLAHARMDIFVNPAPFGVGFKVKTAEAMAAGLPVVATPAGAAGLTAAIGTGLVVRDSAAGFADAILALAGDFARRQQMAAAARAHVAAALAPERCFAPLFDRLAAAGAAHAAPGAG